MAQIEFDYSTLNKVKSKSGVYSKLNKPIPEKLKVVRIETLIMEAFKDYATKRGCSPEMLSKESKLFQSYLRRYL